YDSQSKAFEALMEGSVQALAIDYLQACNYISDLYSQKCKIISPPLSAEGIKLVTLAKEEPYLLKLFNEGVQQLKKNGVYDKLLKKWKLRP
ncbi:MAG: transporter substrate-binding domain-containing protein, partial [Chlamydiae bacterium]|nr:transporter substrate-binding domain-containing protein [Chlamydiota bacterium]